MTRQILLIIMVLVSSLLVPTAAFAKNTIVVIPLGNSNQVKPIPLDDVLSKQHFFFQINSAEDFFTVTDESAFVVTMLHAVPDRASSVGTDTAKLRLCRTLNNSTTDIRCDFTWRLPNDKITQLDFGSGYLFQTNGTYRLDFTSFGNEIFNGFSVFVFGYRVDK